MHSKFTHIHGAYILFIIKNAWKNGGCTLRVVEKSPGRKIERKQYVVLIENEVPNLVLADSDFSITDYSDGWT